MWGLRVIPVNWPYPAETYEAFAALRAAGFTAYCCGDRHAPCVLVAAYDWEEGYVDVVTMRGADRVTAARLPNGLDIFAPHQAVWHYMGALEPAVAAMLRLPPPGHPDAPITEYQAPLTLFVSSREQRTMTIKPGRTKPSASTTASRRVSRFSNLEPY
jgi:hypothetical protein